MPDNQALIVLDIQFKMSHPSCITKQQILTQIKGTFNPNPTSLFMTSDFHVSPGRVES